MSFNKCREIVKNYLYKKYLKRGHNFAFRSVTIKRDIGISSHVIGRALNLMFKPDYDGDVFAEVIHKTRSNKRTVWKTCFRE